MRQRLEGANLRDYSSSAAIEWILAGGNGVTELDTPLERDLRALKTAGYITICVTRSNGRR